MKRLIEIKGFKGFLVNVLLWLMLVFTFSLVVLAVCDLISTLLINL